MGFYSPEEIFAVILRWKRTLKITQATRNISSTAQAKNERATETRPRASDSHNSIRHTLVALGLEVDSQAAARTRGALGCGGRRTRWPSVRGTARWRGNGLYTAFSNAGCTEVPTAWSARTGFSRKAASLRCKEGYAWRAGSAAAWVRWLGTDALIVSFAMGDALLQGSASCPCDMQNKLRRVRCSQSSRLFSNGLCTYVQNARGCSVRLLIIAEPIHWCRGRARLTSQN